MSFIVGDIDKSKIVLHISGSLKIMLSVFAYVCAYLPIQYTCSQQRQKRPQSDDTSDCQTRPLFIRRSRVQLCFDLCRHTSHSVDVMAPPVIKKKLIRNLENGTENGVTFSQCLGTVQCIDLCKDVSFGV